MYAPIQHPFLDTIKGSPKVIAGVFATLWLKNLLLGNWRNFGLRVVLQRQCGLSESFLLAITQ
jgi:hypothetical protein